MLTQGSKVLVVRGNLIFRSGKFKLTVQCPSHNWAKSGRSGQLQSPGINCVNATLGMMN